MNLKFCQSCRQEKPAETFVAVQQKDGWRVTLRCGECVTYRTKVLPSYKYRDPALVLEQMEQSTCKGCIHQKSVEFGGATIPYCNLRKPYGRRCKRYDDGSG